MDLDGGLGPRSRCRVQEKVWVRDSRSLVLAEFLLQSSVMGLSEVNGCCEELLIWIALRDEAYPVECFVLASN